MPPPPAHRQANFAVPQMQAPMQPQMQFAFQPFYQPPPPPQFPAPAPGPQAYQNPHVNQWLAGVPAVPAQQALNHQQRDAHAHLARLSMERLQQAQQAALNRRVQLRGRHEARQQGRDEAIAQLHALRRLG